MRLLTGSGSNFISKDFNKFLKQHRVKHFYTIVYHSQTNGMNEKVNDTIITSFRIVVQEKPKSKWSTLLPDVIAKHNSTIHLNTGFMPKFLMFGIQDGNPNHSLFQARRLAFERVENF